MSTPLVQSLYQFEHTPDSARDQRYTIYTPTASSTSITAQQDPRGHMQATFASGAHYTPADYYNPGLLYPQQQDLVGLGIQFSQSEPLPPTPPHLEVLSIAPTRGIPGGKLTVEFRSFQDFCRPPYCFFTVIFRDIRACAVLDKMEAFSHPFHYTLTTDVPTCNTAAWVDTLPLFLSMEDETGQSLGMQSLGDFQYTPTPFQYSASPYGNVEVPREVPSKRKMSHSGDDFVTTPTKRPLTQSSQWLRNKSRFDANSNALVKCQSQPGASTPFHMEDGMSRFSQSPLPPRSFMGLLPSQSQSFEMAFSPNSTYPFTSFNGLRSPDGFSSLPSALSTPMPSHTFAGAGPNPTLMRTSTIAPNSTGCHLSSSGGTGATPAIADPYGVLSSKAVLKIGGSLDAALDDWSDAEWATRRRLIEFERMQTGNVISTSFAAVTPESRAPNSICISCIWWEEKHEAFVTSVDTIYLLESLVAVRFTVEEKNRIRRNLEGFRPLTVSKGKPDSESFFKVIMGFPNPKPRNIEKDVKVFPWKILSLALKKIIGKYSASYTSASADFPISMTYSDGPCAGLSPAGSAASSSSPPSLLGPNSASTLASTSTTDRRTPAAFTPFAGPSQAHYLQQQQHQVVAYPGMPTPQQPQQQPHPQQQQQQQPQPQQQQAPPFPPDYYAGLGLGITGLPSSASAFGINMGGLTGMSGGSLDVVGAAWPDMAGFVVGDAGVTGPGAGGMVPNASQTRGFARQQAGGGVDFGMLAFGEAGVSSSSTAAAAAGGR